MKFKSTSKYPKDEVRRLVDFATKGVNLNRVSVHVRNSRHAFRGRAYQWTPYISSGKGERLMVVAIGKESSFPRKVKYPGLKTAPEYWVQDWQEALLVVAAHEARHIQQFQRNKPRSEIDAEKFAVRRLEEYRHNNY